MIDAFLGDGRFFEKKLYSGARRRHLPPGGAPYSFDTIYSKVQNHSQDGVTLSI